MRHLVQCAEHGCASSVTPCESSSVFHRNTLSGGGGDTRRSAHQSWDLDQRLLGHMLAPHARGWKVQFGVWTDFYVCVVQVSLCRQSLLKNQETIRLPRWFIASEPALLPAPRLCEAFELWLVVFVKRIFHFIWLSVVRGKLRTAWFALRLSIHLTWEENYDLVNSCMPASSTANTSIIHLKAFIFYWYYFQVTIHNVVSVTLPSGNLDGGRHWAHYLALW